MLLVAATLLIRSLSAQYGPDHMHDDRDAYLAIARGLAEGRGYCVPGSDKPTAYRPPLYPVLIAPVSGNGRFDRLARLGLHVVMAGLTAFAIWRAGCHLGLATVPRVIAAGLMAIDPLLMLYANFPMTETLCTLLGAWLLERCVDPRHDGQRSALTGFVFGLSILSRPTFLASGVLLAAWAIWSRWAPNVAPAGERTAPLRCWGIAAAGALLTVSPWMLRNWLVLGTPLLTTTHGGYTLLLGNNPDFYAQVVAHSWSTVWEGEGQQQWASGINETMDRLGLGDELARDRWMSWQALQTMAAHPSLCLKASLTRIVQFWQIVPGGDMARRAPRWTLAFVAVFYLSYWIGAVRGAVAVLRLRLKGWGPVLLIPLSFMLVHSIYWSNMRMRAPVMPAVALAAAVGIGDGTRRNAQ